MHLKAPSVHPTPVLLACLINKMGIISIWAGGGSYSRIRKNIYFRNLEKFTF